MVAYSFKRRFVAPILVGLGVDALDLASQQREAVAVLMTGGVRPRPKRQTIRAEGLRRHARAEEELQLYCAMRTKQCFLIGRARCVEVEQIYIRLRDSPVVKVGDRVLFRSNRGLDRFAEADGFVDWDEFREFWRVEHPGVTDFVGVLITWRAQT